MSEQEHVTTSGLPPPGPNCEINLDDCASNPCDSGTCLDKIDGYECACEPGYTGEPPRIRGPAGLCPSARVGALTCRSGCWDYGGPALGPAALAAVGRGSGRARGRGWVWLTLGWTSLSLACG